MEIKNEFYDNTWKIVQLTKNKGHISKINYLRKDNKNK